MSWLNKIFGGSDEEPKKNNSGEIAIRWGKYTSIGYYRDNNEDRVAVDESINAYIVADGMGGQMAGEQASQITIDSLPKLLRNIPDDAKNDIIKQHVSQAVMETNRMIIELGERDSSLRNMGTTLVMAYIRGRRIYIAALGDSPAYLVRNGEMKMLTTDHNLAQVLVETGTISKEESRNHKYKHRLYKFLGAKEADATPDIFEVDLQAGDRIVLATDGVTGAMEDAQIKELIDRYPDPQRCAEALVQASLDAGSRDNTTCVIINVDN